MEIGSIDEVEETLNLDNQPSDYLDFVEAEGIPNHTGLMIYDVNNVETAPWDRTGQRGAFINLYGMEGATDIQVHELEGRGETKQIRHLHEQIVYVSQGSGMTVIGEGENEQSFEWKTDSLFFVPPNTPYKHVNLSEEEPARLLAETPLPQLLTMVRNERFIFENDFDFWSDVDSEDYYDTDGALMEKSPDSGMSNKAPVYWLANFIPDIAKFDKLEANTLRGAGGATVGFPFPQTSMYSHISEFPTGTYKKAHRHHPGANVCILSGEGYTLMWRPEWDEKVKMDWQAGSLFTPPARWYHQHFNTGSTPARYFALHGTQLGTLKESNIFDSSMSFNQIEYTEEDPAIRELYEETLREQGIESNMPDDCYTDPEFEF